MPKFLVEASSFLLARIRAADPFASGSLVVALATLAPTANAGPVTDASTEPVVAAPETARGDPADLVSTPPPQATCIPSCRSGFVCHEGQCISACNPVCEAGQMCTDDGECIASETPAPVVAPAPTPTATPAVAPTPTPTPAAPPATPGTPQHPRTGWALTGELGLRACLTDACRARDEFENGDIVRPGVSGRVGAAYRFIPWVSALVEIDVGLHGLKYRNELVDRAYLLSWSAVAVAMAHPLSRTRWDPFIGFGLGYEQDIVRTDGELVSASGDFFDVEIREQTRRGVFRTALGLAVFMDPKISLGARITVDRQFAGRQCFEATFLEQDCVSVRSGDLPGGSTRDVVGDGIGRLFASFGVFARFHL